jgi:tRNA1Val (adenine37-N6)-methyltransferase
MKRSEDFHFKQFSISHDRSTHKIGTDGVLLGAWVNVQNSSRILDIGTGTGVIALMLAQRTGNDSKIDAVEIEKTDADQARENVKQSPWPEKVKVIHSSIQNFSPGYKYDLIISNPPYFINSWRPPENKRSQARHTDKLSFEELLQSSLKLLQESGKFAVILPYEEGLHFIDLARNFRFYPARQVSLRSRVNKPIERLLLEFSHEHVGNLTGDLILHSEGNEWSDEYRALTRDFYLKI